MSSTPETATQEPAPVAAEAQRDTALKLLDATLAKHGIGPGEDSDPGDEAPEAEQEYPEASERAEEEKEPEEGGDKPAEPEGSDEPDELDEAYKALQVDGWRLADLKGLSKASLIRMGKAATKRQADVRSKFDSHSAEIGTLKQKLESIGKSEAEPERESTGQPASANLAEIAKRFAEVAGIEQRDAEPILSELGNSFTAPLRKELEASNNALQALGSVLDELVFERVQAGLEDRFPQIKTAEGVASIKKQLKRLNPAAYSDLSYRERAQAMVEDAAGLAFKVAEQPQPKPKVAPKRNQPSLPGPKTKPHRLDPEAAAMDTWKALERKHGVA